MSTFYQQILTLLTTPPGNLAYHLVMAFSIAWALQSALTFWRLQASPQARRLLFGLSVLLVLRLALFAAAIATTQGWFSSPIFLPAFDRLITTLGLVVIIWMWAYPEPLRPADLGMLFAALFAVVVFLLNLTWGNPENSAHTFNQTDFDLSWEVLDVAILVVGYFLLGIRRPNQWSIGLGMLSISLVGHLAHLISPQSASDLPGAVRLAQLAAYPLLVSLPQRFIGQQPDTADRWELHARQHTNAALEEWFNLQSNLPDEKSLRLLVHFLAHTFDANVAAILQPDGDKSWKVLCQYTPTEDTYADGAILKQSEIPILDNALRRGRPLRLPASSTSVDLRALMQTLQTPGSHLLAAPVSADEIYFGLVLLSSKHSWDQKTQTLLWQIAQTIAQEKTRQTQWQTLNKALEQSRTALQTTEQARKAAEQAQKRLTQEIKVLRAAPSTSSASDDLEALLEAQETAQKLIAQLQSENQNLKKQLEQSGTPSNNGHPTQLEKELRAALSEIARLQQLLSEADRRALLAKKSEPVTDAQRQALVNISQELRQPMSSILGYTDLLLGESVGILGALQRKFLERIHASIERMGALIEDLIQVVTVGTPPTSLVKKQIALSKVIDYALATTGSLMREKSIALRISLPENLPVISADQDSLQQALIHLLQNAASVTPNNGEVNFSVRFEREEGRELAFALLQITDQGGGIPSDDIPHIFSRLYHSENASIPGVGENSVGLATAKTLIEAQGGRLWADSQPQKGTTFSVLLPLAPSKSSSPATEK